MSVLTRVLVCAALAALALTLLVGGFRLYQWVLAGEAALAALVLLVLHVRWSRHDPRSSTWPPPLPLAVIAAAGAIKSWCVAIDRETPLGVIVLLFGGVAWFFVSSWRIWRAEQRP